MNISQIINFILLIFIVHLILINLNISKLIRFENNTFSMNDYNSNIERYTPPTLSESINDEPDDLIKPQDELYKYIHESNYYADNNNSSNFTSNVMKINNFYEKNEDVNIKIPDTEKSKINSQYSEFNPECPIVEQDQYTSIDDLRAGFTN